MSESDSLMAAGAGVMRERLEFALASAATLAAALCLFLFDPVKGYYPPCPFHFLTGLYCPGCGTLRALSRLLHGDLAGAFGYNPLTVLVLPYIAYESAARGLAVFAGLRLPRVRSRWFAWALFGIMVALWVLRNIPAWPFTLLAP